jgi:phosphatidate cytidylyltransferase
VNSFLVRSLSAIILAPIVLYIVYLGGLAFQFTALIILMIGLFEWHQMCRHNNNGSISVIWLFSGTLYILASIYCLYWLRLSSDAGHILIYWLLCLVWAADTGAYIAGSLIGGPKLAPNISPKKTWSGLIGALVSAIVVGIITGKIIEGQLYWTLVIISLMIGALSQGGDLLQSYAKRYFGVKDSGKIIPGHGGILDRIDGLMAAALGAALVQYVNPGFGLSWK